MKRILFLLVAVAPLVAFADKNYTKGKGGTWDCKKDPVVNISHGSGTYKFTGSCSTINVSGGSLKITADKVGELNVTGAKNTVTVNSVGTINVSGAKNKITYKGAVSGDAPQIDDNGVDNTITGPAAKPAAGTTTTTTTAPAAPTGGTAIDCAKTPSFTFDENNGSFTFAGKCDTIAINGNDTKVTAESVKSLSLPGNNNTATLTAVDSISTFGNNNKVTYKKPVTANAKVKISNPGNNNSVKLLK